jgi:lipopolysaccharide/colanic/teichoic acid biosynthesis glycosyltransferase
MDALPVYEKNDLAEGGKMGDDFRVTTAGKFFRKFWIDELPMIINLFKGDLKIVGVRPLSQHFLSLYSQELKDLRLKHKPGLVPPFYADLPKTLDKIMDSEIRYLKAYEKNPLLTDIKYFIKSFYNILIKKARSQ